MLRLSVSRLAVRKCSWSAIIRTPDGSFIIAIRETACDKETIADRARPHRIAGSLVLSTRMTQGAVACYLSNHARGDIIKTPTYPEPLLFSLVKSLIENGRNSE